MIHVFCESDRRVPIIHWGFMKKIEDDGDNGAMVLVTFAETKVTRPPGRDPATSSRETANKLRAQRCYKKLGAHILWSSLVTSSEKNS